MGCSLEAEESLRDLDCSHDRSLERLLFENTLESFKEPHRVLSCDTLDKYEQATDNVRPLASLYTCVARIVQ